MVLAGSDIAVLADLDFRMVDECGADPVDELELYKQCPVGRGNPELMLPGGLLLLEDHVLE